MRVLGIIAEYNPFHNGHAYHLSAAKEASGADYTVAVMSGHFTQRGEPGITDKWTRARMALAAGVDAVFELPALFAVRSAEPFAFGGVSLLQGLGVVTHLGFGTEHEEQPLMEAIAELWLAEPLAFRRRMGQLLKEGESHGSARTMAAIETLGNAFPPDLIRSVLRSPNSMLGICYLLALKKIGSAMVPVLVKRTTPHMGARAPEAVQGHGKGLATGIEETGQDGFPGSETEKGRDPDTFSGESIWPEQDTCLSASLVRRKILTEPATGLPYLPKGSAEVMQAALHRNPAISRQHFDDLLLAVLRRADWGDIAALPDMGAALANRLHRAAAEPTLEQVLQEAKARQVPYTRLQRAVMHLLLGITGDMAATHTRPEYGRLLGFRVSARPLLAGIKERAALPIVAKAADYAHKDRVMWRTDVRATDLYALGMQDPLDRMGGKEYTTSPIVMDG